MIESLFTQMLVLHIIAVMVAVGTVTVTDYLHILGLRDPRLERKSLFVFPHLSRLIVGALIVIYFTGAYMVAAKPQVLQSELFWVKMFLVFLVTINGYFLHHAIFPKIEHGVKNNKFSMSILRKAAFAGSLSVVSWYGIVILALTKDTGYSALQFVIFYLAVLVIAYFGAMKIEVKKKIKKK